MTKQTRSRLSLLTALCAALGLLALAPGCAVHARPGYAAVRPASVYVHTPRAHVRVHHRHRRHVRRCSHRECRRHCNAFGCHDRCRRVYHPCY